jgi:uncharacterized membrane protein YdfJ with MMPL/SSD domain
MEALVVILALITGLIALDLASLRWGADSREMLPDDHRR